MHITIERDSADWNSEVGVFGRMLVDGKLFARTCEQPWRDNQKGHSCIPEGDYELRPHNSAKHGLTVSFHNPALNVYAEPGDIPPDIDGRSVCLIHAANWPSQLQGCVAPGEAVTNIPPGGKGVTSSRVAMGKLMNLWGNRKGLTATIRWSA